VGRPALERSGKLGNLSVGARSGWAVHRSIGRCASVACSLSAALLENEIAPTNLCFSASIIQLLPLDRIGFLRPLGQAVTKGWQFLNITTPTKVSPFRVYSRIQQISAGAQGDADRPDLVSMPHCSMSPTVRDGYFGLGQQRFVLQYSD
jgi:hypothetical protein